MGYNIKQKIFQSRPKGIYSSLLKKGRPAPFTRLFVIRPNKTQTTQTMPLALKTIEVQIDENELR